MPESITGTSGSIKPEAKAALKKARAKPRKATARSRKAPGPSRQPTNWIEDLYVLSRAGDPRAKETLARIKAKGKEEETKMLKRAEKEL